MQMHNGWLLANLILIYFIFTKVSEGWLPFMVSDTLDIKYAAPLLTLNSILRKSIVLMKSRSGYQGQMFSQKYIFFLSCYYLFVY